MEETKKKTSKIEDAKERLVEAFNGAISGGIESLDTEEAGAVTDMIKDLAEAEEKCWKACYYKKIVEAMDESNERMGYDRYRYANGEFAPKGRGTRGYTPVYMEGEDFYKDMSDHMLGYTPDDARTNRGTNNMAANGTRRMGYHQDPVDELAELWQEADHDTKVRMKSALEEMVQQIGA